MRDVKEIPFPLTCLSCVALTPYMHKPEQVFGETAEAEYADVVHSLSRQRDDRSFRTLARSHLLARVRFVVVGFEHLTSMSQALPLQNLNRGTIKRTAS